TARSRSSAETIRDVPGRASAAERLRGLDQGNVRFVPQLMCHNSVSWLRRLSADEHNLAAGSRFKDLFMRAGRLGEWQFLAHDGAQRAIFEPRNESGVDVRLFVGTSSSFRTSGPPSSRTRIAFIFQPPRLW